MTALEYMEKQVDKLSLNYVREYTRKAPQKVLTDILAKMGYYATACEALRKVGDGNG